MKTVTPAVWLQNSKLKLYGLALPVFTKRRMAPHSHAWRRMAPHSRALPHMAMHGAALPHMARHTHQGLEKTRFL